MKRFTLLKTLFSMLIIIYILAFIIITKAHAGLKPAENVFISGELYNASCVVFNQFQKVASTESVQASVIELK